MPNRRANVVDDTKPCSRCKETKPLDQFAVEARGPAGRRSHCRRCDKHESLMRRYGLSIDEWERMAAEQGYCCASCKRQKPLHVDHHHETGMVRGLLCGDCNKAAGLLHDSVTTATSLARYLAWHQFRQAGAELDGLVETFGDELSAIESPADIPSN